MGGSRHSVLLSHCLYVMLHHICHKGPSPPFYLSQYILSAVIIKVTGAPLYLSQSISSSRSCLLSSLWSFLVVVVLIIVFVVFNVLIVSAAYLLIHCFSSPPSPYSSASKSTPNTLASSLHHHHHHHLAHQAATTSSIAGYGRARASMSCTEGPLSLWLPEPSNIDRPTLQTHTQTWRRHSHSHTQT